jgi:hypothetical protein
VRRIASGKADAQVAKSVLTWSQESASGDLKLNGEPASVVFQALCRLYNAECDVHVAAPLALL